MNKSTIFLILIIVLLGALLIANTEPMKSKGLIIRIKPLNFAMVFAHGDYEDETIIIHKTTYEYNHIPTYEILKDLKKEGYNKVWVSMCNTRKYQYLLYTEKEQISWDDLNMTIYKSRLLGEEWF